ncbi:type I restriction enzyme endonuclease domain-containing protein [Nostocoides australiense]
MPSRADVGRARAAHAQRSDQPWAPLNDDQLAFYDAVADNESAREVMGDEVLETFARELVAVMRRDIKTDWTVRDDVRATLRSSIKRLLVTCVPGGRLHPPGRVPKPQRSGRNSVQIAAEWLRRRIGPAS